LFPVELRVPETSEMKRMGFHDKLIDWIGSFLAELPRTMTYK
jgi:hypothetical protein